MTWSFIVPGPAIGKAKKFNRATGYGFNPKAVDAFMNLVAMAARDVLPPRILGAVDVTIVADFEWPRSKWRTRSPRGRARMTEKPDADNIAKSVLDGLRAHFHDQQVSDLVVRKRRAAQGEPARTTIIITVIGGGQSVRDEQLGRAAATEDLFARGARPGNQ